MGGGGESIVSVKKSVEEYALCVIVTQVFMSVSDQSERHGVTDNYSYQYDSVRVQGLDHGFAEIMWGRWSPKINSKLFQSFLKKNQNCFSFFFFF